MTRPAPAALHHTCFVVDDLEGAARALSESLGIGPWNVWTIEPERATVRGVDQHFSFRIALAEIGGASYELITPHLGESVYDEHLAQHGNGFGDRKMNVGINQARHESAATAVDDLGICHRKGFGRDFRDQAIDDEDIGVFNPLLIDAVEDMEIGEKDL